MKSLRRLRRRGAGGTEAGHHASDGGDGPAAGPLSAPFDEAEAAGRGEMRFKHVLMNIDVGEGSQRHRGGDAHKNTNEATLQHTHVSAEKRAKSPLLASVRAVAASPPTAKPAPPSSPTSMQRRGRARQKLDSLSREHRRHLLQQHRRPGVHAPYSGGGSSTTADTSDTSSPQRLARPRTDGQSEKKLSVVPPSSLTRHLAAACDVMKEVNDGMCHANDVGGLTANTSGSLDDSYYSKHDFLALGEPQMPDAAIDNRENGKRDNSRIRYTGIHPEYDTTIGKEAGQEVKLGPRNEQRHDHEYRPEPPQRRSGHTGAGAGAGRDGAPEKAPKTATGIHPESDANVGREAGQEVKLAPTNARRHDHEYRPSPPQRRSGHSMGAGQAGERRRVGSQTQAPRRQTNQRGITLRKDGERQEQPQRDKARGASHARLQVEVVAGEPTSRSNVAVTPKEFDSPHRAGGGERSRSVPKERVLSPLPVPSGPTAVTPSPLPAKEPPAKAQRPKSALRTRQHPEHRPQQQRQPDQNQPPERPRPKSAPPARPGGAVDAPESTTPSAAPTAKVANNSSRLLGRLLRRHRKGVIEPEEEGPANPTRRAGEEPTDPTKRVKVVVVPQKSVRMSPSIDDPALPTEPPKVRRMKEDKGTEPPEESDTGKQPMAQPGGRRPDPPAAYRHMHSTVEQTAVKGKKNPPAAHRHMPSTVVDPTPPSTSEPRSKLRTQPQQSQPNRPTPPPPSQLKSQRLARRERSDAAAGEWTTPLPFKKVNSTPSNFSSFFTSNTASTSKFWEGVEEFSDPTYPKRRLFDNDDGGEDVEDGEVTKESHARRHEEHFERHLVDVTKERLEKGYRRNASGAKSPPRRGANRTPRSSPRASPRPQSSALGSAHDEDISNAFSLKLPMNRHGAFDDSDISQLMMNDSATVYYQRQQSGSPDYWKRKYDRLKEETEMKARGVMEEAEVHHRSTEEAEMQVELEEIIDHGKGRQTPQSTDARGSPAGQDSVEETYDETLGTDGDDTQRSEWDTTFAETRRRCASPLDAINELLDGVIDLDNCEIDQLRDGDDTHGGDYHGGKKGRDRKRRAARAAEGLAAKCSAGPGLTQGELDWIATKAQSTSRTMRKAAEEVIHTNCLSKIEEGSRGRDRSTRCASNDVLQYQNMCSAKNLAEDALLRSPDQETSVGSDDFDLRPAGYVPREGTPTGSPTEPKAKPNPSPTYAMEDEENDIALLSQYRKNRTVRSPNALADDLTAGASRLSRHTNDDQSELSENAKMIFDAALQHDGRALRGQQGRSAARSAPPRSTMSVGNASKLSSMAGSAASHFGSYIPPDFASWFELPSPGSTCIPLLPLLDVQMRSSIGVYDAEDVSSRCRADDAVELAFSDFARVAERTASDGATVESVNVGPIVADGDNGSVRFADASTNLPQISTAAVSAISRRQFQDATEVYNTLLRSCQTSSGSKLGLVGQLIASTLHNLSVLHIWAHEYDQALPYCRESLRIKVELVGDDAGSVNLWANLGLINYATGSLASSLAAFRKAVQMSFKYYPDGQLTGKLTNNLAVVNFEMGKLPLVQSQFRQSLQLQKGTSSSLDDDTDVEAGEDLFSISITIFNVGVVCARQEQNPSAASHIKACLAIQQALLESEVVHSTGHYLDSVRKRTAPSAAPPKRNDPVANQPQARRDEPPPARAAKPAPTTQPAPHARDQEKTKPPQPRKSAPQQRAPPTDQSKRGTSTLNSNVNAPSSTDQQVSHWKGAQNTSHTQRQQVASRILRGAHKSLEERGRISQPMLSLGSLKAEATVSQRVQHSLEGCTDSLALQGFGKGHNNMSQFLCKRPTPIPKRHTVSQSIINFGVQTMKKREAESELQQNLDRYGPRHPLVGESHRNLGLFHLYTENYRDAVAHLADASRILTNALGDKHPDVVSTLMFKGLAQLAFGRLDASLASMRQVRRIREQELGRKHPEIGQILNNMACVHYELGDIKTAESLFQEAMDLQREVFTTEPAFLKGVSIVLCNIAFLHAKSGCFPKALIELEGALQIRQDILLEDNSLDITQNMAHILAISQLQHGAVNLQEVTEEYILMLKSETRR